MHDGRDLVPDPLASPVGEPQGAALDVARDRGQPLVRGQPARGVIVVLGAHERVDATLVPLQEARQNLPSHESRGAGEEHGAHLRSFSKGAPG